MSRTRATRRSSLRNRRSIVRKGGKRSRVSKRRNTKRGRNSRRNTRRKIKGG